jgi:transposase
MLAENVAANPLVPSALGIPETVSTLCTASPSGVTRVDEDRNPRRPGETARAGGHTLESRRMGALPVLDRFIKRLRIEGLLRKHLPREDRRSRVPAATAVLLLVRNLLISREPLYGVGEWAARHDTHWLGLSDEQLPALNDDRVGRALDRLFDADVAALALDVAAHAVSEFDVTLDELHNDSTTVTFHGDYDDAERERSLRGRLRLAVTWGHNKDHRPDLKQLLYILTVSGDGAVPVHFRVESGNATDDRSHRETWDLLCKRTGRRDFLYVADCKLATAENMAHIHQHGGRFLSVLPRTRSEDAAFRLRVARRQIDWRPIHDKRDDDGRLLDQFSICEPASQSSEGYRLIWYHSRRKAELDAEARLARLERAVQRLDALRQKLGSPRTRYRLKAKVVEAVEAILQEFDVGAWITVEVTEQRTPKYRQEKRGRPGKATKYVKSQEDVRFDLKHQVDLGRLTEEATCDGIVPLITNERSLSELQLLLAYKQQPAIERRFEQMKTDFVVAPVYLKEASRIQALLCVYFFVLLVEALLERELRRAMVAKEIEGLPLYPEGRACRRPTARKVIDLFEDVQRHTLVSGKEPPVEFATELTQLQRKILRLLAMANAYQR